MRLVLVLVMAVACGGSQRHQPAVVEASSDETKDPHRKLTAQECGELYDFMKQKGWLAQPDAQREAIVAGCLEIGGTEAFHHCIFGSTTREEADRCQ